MSTKLPLYNGDEELTVPEQGLCECYFNDFDIMKHKHSGIVFIRLNKRFIYHKLFQSLLEGASIIRKKKQNSLEGPRPGPVRATL